MEQIIKPTKYIDPMVDVAFKLIIGTRKDKYLKSYGFVPGKNYRNYYGNSHLFFIFAEGAEI